MCGEDIETPPYHEPSDRHYIVGVQVIKRWKKMDLAIIRVAADEMLLELRKAQCKSPIGDENRFVEKHVHDADLCFRIKKYSIAIIAIEDARTRI